MGYADKNYYTDTYKGKLIGDEDLEQALEEASDQIDLLTYNRIVGRGFENLTAYQQNQVQKAVCTHADFVEQYGAYINAPLSGYSAGSISVSFNTDAIAIQNGVKTSKEVFGYLQQTGLTSRRLL